MCLKIKSKILTATEPITVYKELIRHNGKFTGPYRQRCKYKKGDIKSVRMFGMGLLHYDPVSLVMNILGKYRVLNGNIFQGIHACRDMLMYANYKDVVVECTIPVGAKYVLGKCGDIVSTKLVVGEAIGGKFAELFNQEGKA
jgi:hypothetical protein